MLDDRIVAVGLLTRSDLHRLGQSFAQAWPVDKTGSFNGLIDAIDEAERMFRAERDDLDQANWLRNPTNASADNG